MHFSSFTSATWTICKDKRKVVIPFKETQSGQILQSSWYASSQRRYRLKHLIVPISIRINLLEGNSGENMVKVTMIGRSNWQKEGVAKMIEHRLTVFHFSVFFNLRKRRENKRNTRKEACILLSNLDHCILILLTNDINFFHQFFENRLLYKSVII